MDKDYELMRDNAAVKASVAISLCNKIGFHMTYANWLKLAQRGKGPKVTQFADGKFYRIADLREWIEGRMGVTIRQAVEMGRLHIPAELGQLAWDIDNQPARRTA